MEGLEVLFQNTFSVAVAAYLLLRMEKRLDALTKAIEQLRRCAVCSKEERIKVKAEGTD